MSFTPFQLCSYYLDGNDTAAFEVFENAGPDGLKRFLGFVGTAREWRQLYRIILDDFGFLDQLCMKYGRYMSQLIQERGVETFRDVLQIKDSIYNFVVARVWEKLLDSVLEDNMRDIFHDRKKIHSGEFFRGLRDLLRRQIED